VDLIVLIAVGGWMNQRQSQIIDHLPEQNRQWLLGCTYPLALHPTTWRKLWPTIAS
jgi:hypothetical protein